MKMIYFSVIIWAIFLWANGSVAARPDMTNTSLTAIFAFPTLICWLVVLGMAFLPRNRPRWKKYLSTLALPILSFVPALVVGDYFSKKYFERDLPKFQSIVKSIEKGGGCFVDGTSTSNDKITPIWDCWTHRDANGHLSVIFIVSGGAGVKSYGYMYQSNDVLPIKRSDALRCFRRMAPRWFEVST